MGWQAQVKRSLTMVTLTPDQMSRAKEANGRRKRITHALICGPYGQLFGTEKQCLKYLTAWDPAYRIEIAPGEFKSMFPNLFDEAIKADRYEINDYKITWDLTNKLIEASETVSNKRNGQVAPNECHKLAAEVPRYPS